MKPRSARCFRRIVLGVAGAHLMVAFPASGQEGVTPAAKEASAVAHAERLRQAGRDTEALAVVERLLLEQPSSVPGLALFLEIAEPRGEARRAVPWAERAVTVDDSSGPAARQLWIRALSAAGLPDSATNVARRWVEGSPLEPAAHSALAALVARRGDLQQAIGVLTRGREIVGSGRLYVQELADLHAASGRYEEAATEWRTMLGWGDAGVESVHLRIFEAQDRRAAVTALRGQMAGAGASLLELRGGVLLSLMLGENEWGRELVTRALADLPPAGAVRLLEDYAEHAREQRNLQGAAWAAAELASMARTEDEREAWAAVAADLAFEAGDLAAARRAFERLRERSEIGSDAHRVSSRRLHSLTVDDDPELGERLLSEHRAGYPRDGEAVTDMTLLTAASWLKRGELRRSRSLLETVTPQDAAGAARRAFLLGRLDVLEGRVTAASGHLELAAAMAGADPASRVEAIHWVSVMRSSDSAAVALFGQGVTAAAKGDPDLLVKVSTGWTEADAEDRAMLVALAAQELEAAGFASEATQIRSSLVRRWPRSPEAPAALLALARSAARTDPGQATRWLELLIVEHPESALAPIARRELAALQGVIPGA